MMQNSWLIIAFQTQFRELGEVVGGDQVRPHELFSSLARAGHQVCVWETNNEQGVPRSYYDGALTVKQLPSWKGFWGMFSQIFQMRRVFKSEIAQAREKGHQRICLYQQVPTAIVFRFRLVPLLTQPGILLFGLARKLQVSIWAALHDLSPDHERTAKARAGKGSRYRYLWLKSVLGELQQRYFLPRANFISVVSEPIRQEINKRYSVPLEKMSVFISGYNPQILSEVVPWRAPRDGEAWTIGYLGSPADVSLDLIMESLSLLVHKNVRLLLAGKDMERVVQHLRSRWSNTDVMDGVAYSDYAKIANQVDLWVIVFNDDYCLDFTWQLKLPMALASGRPTVRSAGRALDLSGLKEHFFVSGTQAEQIAQTIDEILDNPQQAQSRAEQAREHVTRLFSWEQIAQRMIADLSRLS